MFDFIPESYVLPEEYKEFRQAYASNKNAS